MKILMTIITLISIIMILYYLFTDPRRLLISACGLVLGAILVVFSLLKVSDYVDGMGAHVTPYFSGKFFVIGEGDTPNSSETVELALQRTDDGRFVLYCTPFSRYSSGPLKGSAGQMVISPTPRTLDDIKVALDSMPSLVPSCQLKTYTSSFTGRYPGISLSGSLEERRVSELLEPSFTESLFRIFK